ncbi:protein FAR1-RELATED SEQUENCE 5-like [Syzygium oleosum]|uniref:protein FAR1-RELATED SEQUENCE 5-like n=1 Tax=Syzygium oleosum TaxID=219896 RepID=UPI0024B9705B|nr:protein FAR1-RELATED SEQUENCE 5-like [Syzygium oleosum]
MAESEHEISHLAHVMRDIEKDYEFAVGMVFSNELEAYHKYVAYAIGKGFGVRKGHMFKNSKGELTRRTFVCNCEGHSLSSSDKEEKYERYEVRCGCLARIKFKVDNGVYEVIEYISEHNHAFIPDDQKHLIRCGRIMSETCKGVLVDMIKAGIGGTTAYKFLANEAGGSKNLGFNLRDCQNYLQTKRADGISGGDCQSVLNHFHLMQMQNPMFSYAVQVDQDGRMTNLFWRDSMSKFDYDCFGDVLVFDTTYRTNKYNMICAPFVEINHHWKNVLFGCAFLLDETAESFIWLFEAFLKSMGNKAPKTMFTDQDQAMEKAIRTVFPNTQHRLCTWHIGKNANQNIPHLYHKPSFKDKYFLVLMYGCTSEEEFESTWREMEKEWDTANNTWLRRLYDIRHKWSSAFGRDTFTCGIRSSQRSESTNNVFQRMSTKTLTLVEFVHHYEEQVKHMREIETQDDFSSRGDPKYAILDNDILTHAGSVYTRTIFKRFDHEFLQSVSQHISSEVFDGSVYFFTLKLKGKLNGSEYVVKFDPADSSVSCDCKLFELKGWLCRHALKVLSQKSSITGIPSAYILKRWTKGAKEGIVNDEPREMAPNSSKFNRYSTLMHESIELNSLGAEDENTIKIVRKGMEKTKAQIMSYKSGLVVTDDASDDDDNGASLCKNPVLDPHRRKGKGMSYGRLKSSSEKRKKKAKKGTSPTRIESRELVVQATRDETHLPDYSNNSNQFQNAFYPSNNSGPTVNLNFHNQPPYIMPPGIMSGFCPIPSQMQSPYIMPPGIMNGISPFTSQMLEYHNRSHGTILSQGSSNSFQHPRVHELNDSKRTHTNWPK